MDLKLGDKIVYKFPEPVKSQKNNFTGRVVFIADSHIHVKSDENVKLKISNKNLDFIEKIAEEFIHHSENYYG